MEKSEIVLYPLKTRFLKGRQWSGKSIVEVLFEKYYIKRTFEKMTPEKKSFMLTFLTQTVG